MVKKHFFIATGLLTVFTVLNFLLPTSVIAFGFMPFGGRITTVRTPPNVQCVTDISSPFQISPVTGIPGPWSAGPGLVNVGQITPGAWILGLQTGVSSCIQVNGPIINPYPTTFTNFYGTSSSF